MQRGLLLIIMFTGMAVGGYVEAGDSAGERNEGKQQLHEQVYFPPPDAEGGWRTLSSAEDIRRVVGMDVQKLDEAFAAAESSSKNGGVLVVRRGWLVYEKYFGLGHREATPNLASCGKSFTSIAVGILMAEHPELFTEGLDQKIFTPDYFPAEVFPLADPRMAEIRLGHLLAFSARIRGTIRCISTGYSRT